MLKFMIWKARLDFTSGLKCDEQDLELENHYQETGRCDEDLDGAHLEAWLSGDESLDSEIDTADENWVERL